MNLEGPYLSINDFNLLCTEIQSLNDNIVKQKENLSSEEEEHITVKHYLI